MLYGSHGRLSSIVYFITILVLSQLQYVKLRPTPLSPTHNFAGFPNTVKSDIHWRVAGNLQEVSKEFPGIHEIPTPVKLYIQGNPRESSRGVSRVSRESEKGQPEDGNVCGDDNVGDGVVVVDDDDDDGDAVDDHGVVNEDGVWLI